MAETSSWSVAPGHAGYMDAATPLDCEIRPLASCRDLVPHWRALARNALTDNPCLHPEFLLPAAQHLVAFRHAEALLIWERRPDGQRLVGLQTVAASGGAFSYPVRRILPETHLVDTTPLIDRKAGTVAVAALLAFLQKFGGGAALNWRGPGCQGETGAMLMTEASRRGWSVRAVATPSTLPLQPAGPAELHLATSRADVRDAVELHLAIEASGARARAGLASLHDTREAGFLRAMTRSLAARRGCRAAILGDPRDPMAVMILIGSRRTQIVYRTAVADHHAASDPEATLRQHLSLPGGMVGLSLTPEVPAPRGLAARAGDALRRRLTLQRARAA